VRHLLAPTLRRRRLAGLRFLVVSGCLCVLAATSGCDGGASVPRPGLDELSLGERWEQLELAERLSKTLIPDDDDPHTPFAGRGLLLALLLIAAGTLISEDLACISAGLLVAQGRLELLPSMMACYVGILAGDLWLFWTGRLLGRAVVRRAPFRWWVTPQGIERSSVWLSRYGAWVVLITRCVPWTRLPTTIAAGILRTSAPRFLLYFALAGLFWVPLFVGVTAAVGREVIARVGSLRGRFLIAVVAAWLFLLIFQQVLVPLCTWRGRRRLLGRYLRLRHWEFWPAWAVYPPVVLYLLYLGLRYRSLTLFTAVNPVMPAGGFVGESKSAILRALPPDAAPPWSLIPLGDVPERCALVETFRRQHRLELPLVLKPDVGERGRGVRIVRSPREVDDYFRDPDLGASRLVLAQGFAPGVEYGIFWARGPEDHAGEILSITEKRPPVLVGDGRRTLEELILADARAVALHSVYLRENPDAASRIPTAGEPVKLVEIGAHCRGTIFLDAGELATPELRAAFERLTAQFQGFDFGRFDVKVADEGTLRAGGPFRLLEANGVTSESTHMYDRRHSIFYAWRTLGAQWARAFAIGAQRRRLGHAPTPARALWRRWRAARGAAPGGIQPPSALRRRHDRPAASS
jgi:membrane protein DedA with SNARE-associated domain